MATKYTKNTKVVKVIFVALISVPFVASGQVPSAECPTSPCTQTSPSSSPALTELWRDAAAAHQVKLQFVEALQRFVRAQAGTFGDESVALAEAVTAMDRALSSWDATIAKVQARAVRTAADAETHVALATVWLDRYRLNDALRELDVAERRADRADVHALRALAFGALNRPQDAVRSLRRAVALEPDNAAACYTLTQYLTRLGRREEAVDARRGFDRALGTVTRDGAKPIAPFDRVDLLRQTPGVAPVFPQSRYSSAFEKLRAGDYEGAVVALRNASANDPMVTAPSAVRERLAQAAMTLKDGRLDAALDMLRAASDAWPDQSEIHRLLGLAYAIADQQGKSIEHLRKAMALAPDDERARMMLADVLVSERRFAEAERELTGARGSSGQGAYRRSQIYQRQSLFPQAAAAMQQSDAAGPVIGRDYFYQSWGSLLVSQADFDGAVTAYLRRIDVNPNSGEAHRQLGEIYFLQGRDDEALAEFTVATWLDPGDARAAAAAGQADARMLKYPEAIAALRRALMLDGGLREARYALGTVLMRTGRAEEGKAELERFGRQQAEAEALGRREFEIDALRRQASKHALAGESTQAIAVLEQVAALDPQSSRSHRDLGVALLRAKRTAESIDHLQRAQQIDETADGFALLADAYAAVGNADENNRMRAAYASASRKAISDRIRDLIR